MLDPCVPRTGAREATVFGYRMTLDLADIIQRQVYLGTYERAETSWILRVLPRGGSFVDVGANIGYFTALAASLVGPSGRVLAVEPSSHTAGHLTDMVARNKLTWVTVERCALGAWAGEASLPILGPENHNLSPSLLDSSARTETVRDATLDHLLAEHHVPYVDVLKLDVEGYEPRVLAGATDALSTRRIRALVCEFNDVWLRRGGSNPDALYGDIIRLGFRDTRGCPHFHHGCIESRHFVWRNR